MAFTKAPEVSTYETKRFPLVGHINTRDTSISTGATPSVDAKLVNVMPDYVGNPDQPFLKTRPALSKGGTVSLASAVEERGYFVAPTGGSTSYVYGDKYYYNGTHVHTLTTTTGKVGFCEFIQASGNRMVIMLDGTKGYTIDGAGPTVTEITDAQFPTPHIPAPVFLDGYLFIAKTITASGSNELYNSDLDTPSSWTAGSFISAENNPDNIVTIAKINEFILAIGQSSVEYFYDAGNATASPLAVQQGAGFEFGTRYANSVCTFDDECYMIAETTDGEPIIKRIKGFEEETFKFPAISEIVRQNLSTSSTMFAGIIGGQRVLLVNLFTYQAALVFFMDTKLWTFWEASAVFNSGRTLRWPRWWDGDSSTMSALLPAMDVSGVFTGAVATLVMTGAATDSLNTSSNIPVTIVTAKMDNENINRKFMYRFSLVGESSGGADASTVIAVSWTDDDYRNYSTAVNLTLDTATSTGHELPGIFQLGMYRRRAFKFTYSGDKRLRLHAFEADINKGQT